MDFDERLINNNDIRTGFYCFFSEARSRANRPEPRVPTEFMWSVTVVCKAKHGS